MNFVLFYYSAVLLFCIPHFTTPICVTVSAKPQTVCTSMHIEIYVIPHTTRKNYAELVIGEVNFKVSKPVRHFIHMAMRSLIVFVSFL